MKRFVSFFVLALSVMTAARSAPLTDSEKAAIVILLGNSSAYYSIGGSVTYLAGGRSLSLRLNGSETITISKNGAFAFTEDVMGGESYSVTIANQPTGQTCSIVNGAGVAEDDISNISVTCSSTVPFADVIKGRTIDGYIQGATVYLDTNGNGSLDADEPFGTSGEGGRFEIGLNAEQAACKTLAPVVADVPVGAIDESEGEVTEAFQMALPPGTDSITTDQEVFITPLTSVLWAELYALYTSGELPGLSCAELSDNAAAQEELQRKIDQVILLTVQAYNVPADELLSDYVASGSSETERTAQDITAGLQLSLKEQLLLEQAYPNADSVRVVVERSLGSKYNDPLLADANYGWYRNWAVQEGSLLRSGIVRLSEDLTSELYLLFYKEWFPKTTNSSGVQTGYRRQISLASENDIGQYVCVGYEDAAVSLTYSGEKGTFEISTENATSMDVSGWEECDETVHTKANYGQNIFITERARNRADTVTLEQGYYTYNQQTGIPIPATKDLVLDLDSVTAGDLLSKIEDFDWRFYSGEDSTAHFTSKHFEYVEGNKFLIEKFTSPDKQWRQVEYLPDDTTREKWAYAPLNTPLTCIQWQTTYVADESFDLDPNCASDRFDVSATAGGGGQIVPLQELQVPTGQRARMLLLPQEGNTAQVSDNCASDGYLHGLTYTTGIVTEECAVTATFASVGENQINPPAITKAFSPSTAIYRSGEISTLTLTLSNPNVGYDLTAVSAEDTLPTGMTVATTPSTDCASASVAGAIGDTTVSISGAALNRLESCVVSFGIEVSSDGTYTNVTERVTGEVAGNQYAGNIASSIFTAPTDLTLLSGASVSEFWLFGGWDFDQNTTANLAELTTCWTSGECPNVTWAPAVDPDRGSVYEVSLTENAVYAGVWLFNINTGGVNLSDYSDWALTFDLKLVNAGNNSEGYLVTTQCGWPCASSPINTGAVGDSGWETVSIPVADLVSNGLDLSKVDIGFNIYPVIEQQAGVVFRLDNVRWSR